jgi:ATP-dependent RNA helicase DDX42
VTEKDKEMVGHLVRNLEGANQLVPEDLMKLAMQSSWFRKSRFKGGKGKMVNAGLGFRERTVEPGRPSISMPSFVAASSSDSKTISQPTNRLEALKNAFKSQYASQFKTSSDKSWENQTVPTEGVFVKPSSSSLTSQQPQQQDEPKKKKSRWD